MPFAGCFSLLGEVFLSRRKPAVRAGVCPLAGAGTCSLPNLPFGFCFSALVSFAKPAEVLPRQSPLEAFPEPGASLALGSISSLPASACSLLVRLHLRSRQHHLPLFLSLLLSPCRSHPRRPHPARPSLAFLQPGQLGAAGRCERGSGAGVSPCPHGTGSRPLTLFLRGTAYTRPGGWGFASRWATLALRPRGATCLTRHACTRPRRG